jgi:hypothetical protein
MAPKCPNDTLVDVIGLPKRAVSAGGTPAGMAADCLRTPAARFEVPAVRLITGWLSANALKGALAETRHADE